jgi:undecaprenyl phosphate N,N'-diacetylbacillosamine 1-phosphate transferase
MRGWQSGVKRCLDLVLSLLAVMALLPLFIVLGLIVKFTSPGPIIYKQERVGKDGKPFIIYKFRTMVVGAESMGAGYGMVADDPRLTIPGNLLRRFSLDELPELFNVIKGEMSLVGPRPTLQYQVNLYNSEQRGRLRVRPGITGLAQVKGRNQLPWSSRIMLDNWYIDNYSLLLDLKILLATILVVITGEGLRQDQSLEEVEDFHKDRE